VTIFEKIVFTKFLSKIICSFLFVYFQVPQVIPIRKYFINFTKWMQLPKPENETSPVAMTTSDIRKEIVDKEWAHIIDVTLHPSVYPNNDSPNQIKRSALVELVFRYIESKFSFNLSRKFQFVDVASYMGNRDNLLNFICPAAVKNKMADTLKNNNNLTLEQIKSLSNDTFQEKNKKKSDKTELLHASNKQNKPHTTTKEPIKLHQSELMLDNSLTAVKSVALDKNNNNNKLLSALPSPKVEMVVNQEKHCIELTIDLPEVESVNECDLEITEVCRLV